MTYIKKIYSKNNTHEAYETFNNDGIVFFDKLISDQYFNEALLHIEPQIIKFQDTENLVNLHLKDTWFANFVSQPEFIEIASTLLGIEKVKIFSSMILNKPPNGLMTVPWHQDAAYDWPLDPIDCASLWLAFDNVTVENGAMKVAVGGHKNGKIQMTATEKLKTDDIFFSTQLQQSIPEELLKPYEIIDVTMKKGHASFHHSMLPHSSTPNTTNKRRCAFIVRYCRGDARLLKYPNMPREEYFKDFELFDPYINK